MADPSVPDQSAAYRIAYNTKNMKPTTIAREASKLMNNPNIATMIEELSAPVLDKLQITLETVLGEIAKTAFSNVGDFLTMDQTVRCTYASMTLHMINWLPLRS